MKWHKVIGKGILGTLTFLSASLTTRPDLVITFMENPKKVIHLFLGSLIAGFIVAFSNFWKHKNEKT